MDEKGLYEEDQWEMEKFDWNGNSLRLLCVSW